MKKFLIGITLLAGFSVPFIASASTLTAPQVSAIIGLLQAFGVAQSTIDIVYADLTPQSPTTTPAQVSTSTPVSVPTQPSAPASTYTPPTQTSPTVTGVEQPAPVVPSCTLTYLGIPSPTHDNAGDIIYYSDFIELAYTLTNTKGGIISGIDGTGAMRQMYNIENSVPITGLGLGVGTSPIVVGDAYGYEYSTTTVYTLANKDTSCQVTVPPLSQN